MINLVLVVSLIFPIRLVVKLLRGSLSPFEKAAGCIFVLIPVVGPLMYVFMFDPPPPNEIERRDDKGRGRMTHRLISLKDAHEAARKIKTGKDGGRDAEKMKRKAINFRAR